MAVKIELKRSAIPGKVPTVDQLDLGELAINTYDGAIYFKQDTGVSQSIVQVTTTGGTTISASYAVTSSHAITASYALNVPDTASFSVSSSYALTASYALNVPETASFAISSSYALTASYALNVPETASFAISSSYAISASYAVSSSNAISASYALSGSNSISASYALTASFVNPLRQNVQITGSLFISGSQNIIGSGSDVFSVDGTSGRLFEIDDTLSGSLFSVNTVSGLPIIEAFSDNTVRIGQYGTRALYVSQSAVGIGKENALNGKLDISGSTFMTGSLNVSQGITGSLFGTASWAQNAVTASYAVNFYVSQSFTASGLTYPTADNGEESFMQTDGAGTLSLQYVKTIYEEIYNGEATNIVKGTPVYVSGSNGAASIVYRADAGNPAKMPVIYISADTIAPGATGRGIALGLIKGVNTTGYPAGTEIFIAVGGGWTSTRPTGSAIVQVLGYVTKEGVGGQGVVLNPGPVSLPNLTSGSFWVGNSGSVPIAVPTSSIQNVVSSSYALSSSYAVSASYAATASSADSFFVRQNLTASNALITGTLTAQTIVAQTITSSTEYITGSTIFGSLLTNTHQFTGSVSITGSLSVNGVLSQYATVPSSAAGSNILFSQPVGSYTAAFYKYTVSKSTNARSGEVTAVWNGSSVQYTDTSTVDIGNTGEVTGSVALSAGNIQLNLTTTTSGWTLKSYVTYI